MFRKLLVGEIFFAHRSVEFFLNNTRLGSDAGETLTMGDRKNFSGIIFPNIDSARAHENNTRARRPKLMLALKNSIHPEGLQTPILVDDFDVFIDGHGYLVCRALKREQFVESNSPNGCFEYRGADVGAKRDINETFKWTPERITRK